MTSADQRRHLIKNRFEQQFGLRWVPKGSLSDVPSIAAVLAPNDYGITARIRRRREGRNKGYTYAVNKHGSSSHFQSYDRALLEASDAVLKTIDNKISTVEHALSGFANK